MQAVLCQGAQEGSHQKRLHGVSIVVAELTASARKMSSTAVRATYLCGAEFGHERPAQVQDHSWASAALCR